MARDRLRPSLRILTPFKTGSLASPNCRSSLNSFSLREPIEAFDPPALVRPRSSAVMVLSRASAPAAERGPCRAAAHPLTVFLRRRGRNGVAFEFHRRGHPPVQDSWSTASCSRWRLGCPAFLPAGGFPRPSSREPARVAPNSFSRVPFRAVARSVFAFDHR